MVNITISVPEKTRNKMKKHDEVNWSAYLRNQIEKKTIELNEIEQLKEQHIKEKEIEYETVNIQKKERNNRIEIHPKY